MKENWKRIILIFSLLLIVAATFAAVDQTGPLTYPMIVTALNARLPKGTTKEKLIEKLISDVKTRRVDKTLTTELESDLRKAGATEELIIAIRANSPLPTPLPTR